MEEWKDIKGYEGLYQVSNEGNVRSLNYNHTNTIKNLKLTLETHGYLVASLVKNSKQTRKYVHRLVAETFIPNPNNYLIINHKNEKKDGNAVDNLEWCDHKYNNNYGTRNERISKHNINKKNSKQVYQYTLDGKLVAIWASTRECGRNGYNQRSISKCCNGKLKTHKGYIWSYEPL